MHPGAAASISRRATAPPVGGRRCCGSPGSQRRTLLAVSGDTPTHQMQFCTLAHSLALQAARRETAKPSPHTRYSCPQQYCRGEVILLSIDCCLAPRTGKPWLAEPLLARSHVHAHIHGPEHTRGSIRALPTPQSMCANQTPLDILQIRQRSDSCG